MKSFLQWMENEENPALSEPQHKIGEKSLALDKVIEKRLMQFIMELETDGKGSKEEIAKAIKKVIDSNMGNQQQSQPEQPAPQGEDQQTPQPQEAPQPQMAQQQPPQGNPQQGGM